MTSLLKAKPAHYVGHNPAGSVAVYLLLALGIVAGVSGVVIFQDIGGDALEELHEMAAYAMLGVVALHLVGVLVSSLMHRENLVRAMITGIFKSGHEPRHEGIRRAHAWLGVIMLVLVVGFWLGYPATDLVQPNSNVAQAAHHQMTTETCS